MNTLEDLIVARSLIENASHWCQHEERDGNRRCALAALADAANGLTDAHPALLALCEALPKSFRGNAGHSMVSMAAFNDTHAHSQVVALFDRAIERQRHIGAMHTVPTYRRNSRACERRRAIDQDMTKSNFDIGI